MATMCMKEKKDLMNVHNEIKAEMADFLEVVKDGSDVFSQQSILKKGIKPSQMEPFSLASKLVSQLMKAETRHLDGARSEAVFDKLTEQMSDVLEWYEKYEEG